MDQVSVPVIRDRESLQVALDRLAEVFMAAPDTPEADEREALAAVIESYERVHFPIPPPDPISAIRFAMEQQSVTPGELARLLGGHSRVSEIMNGKRSLSLSQIRKLHRAYGIPLESLVAEIQGGNRSTNKWLRPPPI